MKNFTDIFNEAEYIKLKADYTKYLLEKQYAISKETAKILLEEENEDDDEIPFNRKYHGKNVYVHIDVDGRREIKVVGSVEAAKQLAQNFKSAIAFDNGGNEIDLSEGIWDYLKDVGAGAKEVWDIVTDQGFDAEDNSKEKAKQEKQRLDYMRKNIEGYDDLLNEPDIFGDEKDRSKPSDSMRSNKDLAVEQPAVWVEKRKKLKADVEKYANRRMEADIKILGDSADKTPNKRQGVLGALYNDPSLLDALSDEEYSKIIGDIGTRYSTRKAKGSDPLYIDHWGGDSYVTRSYGYDQSEFDRELERIKKRKEEQGDTTPVTEKDFSLKQISSGSKTYRDSSFKEKAKEAAVDWAQEPENIKSTIAMATGLGAVRGGAAALLARAGASPTASALTLGAADAALSGLYGSGVKSRIESETEEGRKGKASTFGAKAAGEVAGELTVGTPFAIVGGKMFNVRTPRTNVPETPTTTPPKPAEELTGFENQKGWESVYSPDYWHKAGEIKYLQNLKPTMDVPELKLGNSPIGPQGYIRPGLPSGQRRRGQLGRNRKLSPKEVERLLKNKNLTDVERNALERYQRERIGKAIGGVVGDRVKVSDTPLEQNIQRALVGIPPESITPEVISQTRKNLKISGEYTPVETIKPKNQYSDNILKVITPAVLPKRPSDYQYFEDYKKAKEQQFGRELTKEESKFAEKEYEFDVRERESSVVGNKTELFHDRGPISISAGSPSRASILTAAQKSPLSKAAGVALTAPLTFGSAETANATANIGRIVMNAIEAQKAASENPGALRVAYRNAKAPKAQETIEASPIADRSMDAIEAARLYNRASIQPDLGPDPRPGPEPDPGPDPSVAAAIAALTVSRGKRSIDNGPDIDRFMDAIEAARLKAKANVPPNLGPGPGPDPSIKAAIDSLKISKGKRSTDNGPDIDRSMDAIEAARLLNRAKVQSDVGRSMDAIEAARLNTKANVQPDVDRAMDAIELARLLNRVNVQPDEDRSMDAIEAARLNNKAKVIVNNLVNTSDIPSGIPFAPITIPASVTAPVIAPAFVTPPAAIPAKTPPKKKKQPSPNKKGGVAPSSSDSGMELPSNIMDKLGVGVENWDLILKNIYGKYAGTLSK